MTHMYKTISKFFQNKQIIFCHYKLPYDLSYLKFLFSFLSLPRKIPIASQNLTLNYLNFFCRTLSISVAAVIILHVLFTGPHAIEQFSLFHHWDSSPQHTDWCTVDNKYGLSSFQVSLVCWFLYQVPKEEKTEKKRHVKEGSLLSHSLPATQRYTINK